MQSSAQQRLSCCQRLYVPSARRPLRSRPDARGGVLSKERYGCGRQLQTCQSMAYGVQQVVQQPREQTSLALRQPAFVISRSQLAGKQVITRTDGRILGVVDGLVADPDTCKIVAVSLIKSNALPGEERLQIGLLSLKQISDVLLVHDERAILREQLTIGLPYIQLVGKAVNTAGGKLVGKVRDFDFSPDDGQVTRLIIDGLGIPALPQRLQACQGVQIQLVQRVTWSCITLVPGVSEADIDKLTSGIFDSAISLLKRSVPFISLTDSGDSEAVDENMAYTNWWIDHSQEYERFIGKQVQKPSEASIAAAMSTRRQAQPQAPQALPPGRQATYASQLQPQAPYAERQRQPEPTSWQQASPMLPSQQQRPLEYSSRASNWPQQSDPQQAQRAGGAQFADQQEWRQSQASSSSQLPRAENDARWQSSQSGSLEFQQPAASTPSSRDRSLQTAMPPQQSRPQQRQFQQQQQSQQQPSQYDQRQQAGPSQFNSYPESVRKVQQQQRFAARQSAGLEELRFDPRRRRSNAQALNQPLSVQQRQAQPPQQTFAAAEFDSSRSAPLQGRARSPQPNTPTNDMASKSPQTYSGPAGASTACQQSPTQSDSARSAAAGPSQDAPQAVPSNLAAGQGYSGWSEQQGRNDLQQSQPQQGPDVAQASPAAGKYSGWAQQAPDAVVDRIAVSPSGTIDIA